MAYDFSPAGVIRGVGFTSPKPSQNFTDDGNFFSVYLYQGDERLPFMRWTKGMQGGISTPDEVGELLGFDGLDGRHSYQETSQILNAMKEDYPDLAKDYEKYGWTGTLSMSQAKTREGFLDYMKECALLGRRLQRYLDGKDPYSKDDHEIAAEHLKDLWTAIRDQGAKAIELDGYEFQLSRKDQNVAWFTGIGRGNWFTITYDPANKNINVTKNRVGSTDISEVEDVEITARAVIDAITEMINSKMSAASDAVADTATDVTATDDTATATKTADTVESDDSFVVEVVESDGRLRVQGDDGVHGLAWVRFPNNLRTKSGRKYKVDRLKWNGKNYTIGGYINFVEDNGSLTRVGQVKLTEDAEDQWNKEALDIDKENTERVLAGLTGKDPLEEEKEDSKTMTNGIDIDRIMKQLKRLEGKKQLKDLAVSGPDVDKVKLAEGAGEKAHKSVTDVFSLSFTEALEILQMLSPEQVDKLLAKYGLEKYDFVSTEGDKINPVLDVLTDYVNDTELEKIRENPEGYLTVEAGGEEETEDLEEGKKSLRDIILLTEDINNPQTVDEWLDKIEKQSADIAALMDEILVDFRKNIDEVKQLLGESKKDENKTKLTEAVKQLKAKTKKLLEDTETDSDAVLADSDVGIEVDNDIDIVETEDKVILDMTTEEGKQEALELLVSLIPRDGVTVEVTNDDGTTETFELEKEEVVVEGETLAEEPAETEEKPEELEEDIVGAGNKVGSIDMTEDAEEPNESISDLAAETKLTIDEDGKVTSGQAVKTIKAKVAKYNKANKTDFKVDYISETDSIVIS